MQWHQECFVLIRGGDRKGAIRNREVRELCGWIKWETACRWVSNTRFGREGEGSVWELEAVCDTDRSGDLEIWECEVIYKGCQIQVRSRSKRKATFKKGRSILCLTRHVTMTAIYPIGLRRTQR